MDEIVVSELIALAYQERKINLYQLHQMARIEPKYQDNLLSKIVGKSDARTKSAVDEYLARQSNPKKKNPNLLKIRGSDLSEIRIDSHALEYRLIAENLLALIPQVNYCMAQCMTTPDWRVDEKTKYSLIVKLGLLQSRVEKLITFINASDTINGCK